MNLKELNLIGFGKFKNKSITLDKGLNIIYGENEAGKSTLHNFIEGMFFGFLKPNARSARYNEEYYKYNPWNKSRYAGIIRFQYEGKVYRIERDFTKGNEDTKIFDETRGKEIGKGIDTGNNRILQPGIHFFGFNTRVFSNTILVKQLQSKTDKKLGNDIREKLVNVNTSLDDNISVDKAILDIKELISNIGTDKAYTKPYAKNSKEIQALEEEKEKININKNNYETLLEQKDNLQRGLNKEKENISTLTKELNKVKILEKKKILNDSKIITREIEELELKKEKLNKFANISMKEYEEGIELNKEIDFLNNAIKDKDLELENIESKIKTLNFNNLEEKNEKALNDLTKDYSYYEELENEKNQLLYKNDDSYIEILKRDSEVNHGKIKRHKKITFILILTDILMAIALYLNKFTIKFIFLPILIAGIIIAYYLMEQRKLLKEKENIRIDIDKINLDEKTNRDKIENINKMQENILDEYKVKAKLELKILLEELQYEKHSKNQSERNYIELKERKLQLEEKLKEHRENLEKNRRKLENILFKNNSQNLKELSIALKKKSLYEESIKEIDLKKQLLKITLGEYAVEELQGEIDELNIDCNYKIERNKEELISEIEERKDALGETDVKLAKIEEQISFLDNKISRLVDIEEEIFRKIEYKRSLDNKLEALNLAKSTIEELSEEIHTEFAPNINKKLSKIVEKITAGKYNNIRISEELDMNLENPNTKEIINIESLSGGTIDQLYFALRFGIIDEITERKLPLFLDDCFIQYDENRLKNVLEFLVNNIGDRQVLLFTCHRREKKILKDLGIDFNFIHLT